MINLGICGIIAEFNPLHNGHKYLIDCAKSSGNTVVCVISGNFVQRGDVAIVPKFTRVQMAMNCGADIVVELPVPWSMSTAQNFALGAVSQLLAVGVDTLYFGSECASIEELNKVADILLSNNFKSKLSNAQTDGATFASTRSKIVSEILGYDSAILDSPNDTLAVEYICASKKLGADLLFVPIRRIGSGHNDTQITDDISNATLIREELHKGNEVYKYIPNECADLLSSSPIADIIRLDTAIVSRLKLLSKDELRNLPDISEGIDNLLYNCIREATNFDDLLCRMKTKRYTLARVRRLILSAFLGVDNRYFGQEPPYVRVLGFRSNKLNTISNASSKPIITKVSQIKKLNNNAIDLFEKENQINEIYALSLDNPKLFINECSEKLIVK